MARYDLNGKVALVTGGARGIGLATARALVARGASVSIVDLKADAAERAAVEIHPYRTVGLAADVTDAPAVQRAVAETVERFGVLDVVVANAGIASTPATFRAMSPENMSRVLEVNVTGVWRTVEAALPHVLARRGHVVVVSSVYAFVNGFGAVPYAMSKAAVEQLGRALRVELAPHGAGASVAYFGFIDTEMVQRTVDHDPVTDLLSSGVPAPLRERLPPRAAGEAIVLGIEGRRQRIIRPRRWAALSVLRGMLATVTDAWLARDRRIQELVREFDGRGGQEQRTTA